MPTDETYKLEVADRIAAFQTKALERSRAAEAERRANPGLRTATLRSRQSVAAARRKILEAEGDSIKPERAERLRQGLSVTVLAKRAGVARTSLHNYERDHHPVTDETLRKIRVALGLPV